MYTVDSAIQVARMLEQTRGYSHNSPDQFYSKTQKRKADSKGELEKRIIVTLDQEEDLTTGDVRIVIK